MYHACTLKAYCRGALRDHWRDQAHTTGGHNSGRARTHYRVSASAFAGEEIEIKTWVENIRRVKSLRKYEFIRKANGKVLVKGETDWVFVDVQTSAPRAIPDEVSKVFVEAQDKSPYK